MEFRKTSGDMELSGDLDLLRRRLKEFIELVDDTSNAAGNTANVTIWQGIQANLAAGKEIFEEAPKPQTEKKSKRPALNDDLDDVYAIDGYVDQEE